MELKNCCEHGIIWAERDGYRYVFKCECKLGISRVENWPMISPNFSIHGYKRIRVRNQIYNIFTKDQRSFLFRLIKHLSLRGASAELISVELSNAIEAKNKEQISLLIEDIKTQEKIE